MTENQKEELRSAVKFIRSLLQGEELERFIRGISDRDPDPETAKRIREEGLTVQEVREFLVPLLRGEGDE